mgnify:FL=1|jgi:hypothetical protein
MLEILGSIMKMSNDRRSTLLYFLDDDVQYKIQRYELVKKDDLYLKNKLILINKSTLNIDYDGTIEYIKDDKVTIKKNNGNRTLNMENYYLFLKYSNSKKDTRKFFEELLKKL